MNDKKIKRITAAILAVSAAFGLLTSCSSVKKASEPNSVNTGENEPATAVSENLADPVLLSKSFKGTVLPVSDRLKSGSTVIRLSATGELIVKGYDPKTSRPVYQRLNSDLTEVEELVLQLPEAAENADFYRAETVFDTDGSSVSLYTVEDHGGVKCPEEYDENFDYVSFNESYTSAYFIGRHDPSGRLTSLISVDFPEAFTSEEYSEPTVVSMLPDGDDILIAALHGVIYRMSENGEFKPFTEAREPSPEVYGDMDSDFYRKEKSEISTQLLRASDGSIFVKICDCAWVTDLEGVMHTEGELECYRMESGSDNMELITREDFITRDESSGGNFFAYEGRGEYLVYYADMDGMYGMKADGTREEVLNRIESDIEMMSMVMMTDWIWKV